MKAFVMLWILLGFVFLLAACGGADNPLAETEWRLIELGKADSPAQVVGDDAGIEFTTTEDVTGWTGCNSYASRYRVRESELRLTELMWTEAGCPSRTLFQQEQRVQDSLAKVERFEISGGRLTLHSEGGQVLVFDLLQPREGSNRCPGTHDER